MLLLKKTNTIHAPVSGVTDALEESTMDPIEFAVETAFSKIPDDATLPDSPIFDDGSPTGELGADPMADTGSFDASGEIPDDAGSSEEYPAGVYAADADDPEAYADEAYPPEEDAESEGTEPEEGFDAQDFIESDDADFSVPAPEASEFDANVGGYIPVEPEYADEDAVVEDDDFEDGDVQADLSDDSSPDDEFGGPAQGGGFRFNVQNSSRYVKGFAFKTKNAAKTAADKTAGAAKNVATRFSEAKQAADEVAGEDEVEEVEYTYSDEDVHEVPEDESSEGGFTGEDGASEDGTATGRSSRRGRRRGGELWHAIKNTWLAYYPAHKNTVIYATTGFVSALFILAFGFWPILLIAALTVAGNLYGRYRDGDQRISAFFRHLFHRRY